MPKGTVVTLPAEVAPLAKPIPSRPERKFNWGRFTAVYAFAAALVHRSYLPLNVMAFLLGRVSIMGELAPFGLAFFAAVAQVAPARAPAAAVWSVVGVLSSGRYYEAGLYLLAMTLYFRVAGRLTRFERKFQAVPLFVFSVAALGGCGLMVWQDASLYDFLAVFFEAMICMVSAYIFVPGAALLTGIKEENGPQTVPAETLMCLVALLAASVAGLSGMAVWGYSVMNVVGGFAVMALALAGGAGLGVAVGVSVGLVAGLHDSNASTIISIYSIAGLLAGAFRTLGKFAVLAGFLLGSAIGVLYLGQTNQLVQFMAEGAIGAAFFMALPVDWIRTWNRELREGRPQREGRQHPVTSAAAKLNSVAEIFGQLAGSLKTEAGDEQPRIRDAEIARLLATVGEQVCGSCSRRALCWENDFYRTQQGVLDALAVAERGPLQESVLSGKLQDRCIQPGKLAAAIGQVAAQNRVHSAWQKKLAATRQLVAEQTRAISAIVANVAGEIGKGSAAGRDLAASLQEKAALIGCPLDRVIVNTGKGPTTVEVYKQPCPSNRECVNTILPLASSLMKERLILHAECANARQGRGCRLSMRVAGRYGIQTGAMSMAKDKVSGDNCALVPLAGGKVAVMLSDGMGSGRQAAGESAAALKYLERLMAAGFDVDVAVKTVNSLLLLKMPEETFATLDMAIIDTHAGEAEFLKVGSAPSFVKRVREVTTIKTASLPVGILDQIEIEPVKWALAPGDIIVMVSDGVADVPQRSQEKENWVANYLRRIADGHPQQIAEKVLRQAVELAGTAIRDDMTVVVIKILDHPGIEH